MRQKSPTLSIVLTALFAALTFLGTMIKIPMPSGAFAHLGNSVLLLAVLLIGYKKGALAGGLGFAMFDLFNGFAAEAPYFIVESFIVGGAAALIILGLHNKIENIGQVRDCTNSVLVRIFMYLWCPNCQVDIQFKC